MNRPDRSLLAILAVVLITAAGCATDRMLPSPRVDETAVAMPRFAGSVAVHYPPEFRSFVGVDQVEPRRTVQVPLGDAVTSMMNRSLAGLFREIIPLKEPTWTGGTAFPAGLVIVPRFEQFSLGTGHAPTARRPLAYASVRIELSLRDSAGMQLDRWSFSGEGTSEQSGSHGDAHLEAVRLAVRHASARLLVGLSEHPVVAGRFTPEPPLAPARPLERGPGIAVLARFPSSQGDADECVAKAIAEIDARLRALHSARFRDAMFPWWEPGIAPADDAAVEKLLKRDFIARRSAELGLRRLYLADIATSAPELQGPLFCGAGIGGAGCLGVAGAERSSKATVEVWDLASGQRLESLGAESSGTSWAAAFLIPVWRTAPTEKDACQALARQIVDNLKR